MSRSARINLHNLALAAFAVSAYSTAFHRPDIFVGLCVAALVGLVAAPFLWLASR